MTKTLLDLANNLEKRAANLQAKGCRVAVSAALSIIDDLSNITPVDTSKAVSNWQVTLGSKTDARLNPHYPGEYGSTKSPSSKATRDNARNVLQSKKPGVTIYISNTLPYILELNEGSSRQAPAGFVQRSVLIGRKFVRKAKIRF